MTTEPPNSPSLPIPQPFEAQKAGLEKAFQAEIASRAERCARIKLSWSNWGFGIEPLSVSLERLRHNGVEWIELHGNRYGRSVGYKTPETRKLLEGHGVRLSGVCGMFSRDNDLSSPSGVVRQRAVDYIERQLELCHDLGGRYLLVVPGAVGRPTACDGNEFHRSVETLRDLGDTFASAGVLAAIEPIRAAEVSLVHSVHDAIAYLDAVGHPAIGHINGDVYHMQSEERNIAAAILEAGDRLVNLHLADSQRGALGSGSMDVDAIIMALHILGFPDEPRFATPEPLGPGGDPYPAMFGAPNSEVLDALVASTVRHWRARESILLSRSS